MRLIYFPGCKYTAYAPADSLKIQNYLADRFQAETARCCSIDYQKPLPGQIGGKTPLHLMDILTAAL